MTLCQLKFIATLKSGEAIDSADIRPDDEFPVYGGNGLRGYTSTRTHSLAAPLVGRQGALCGNVNFADGNFYATEHAIVAMPRDGVNARWLYWLLGSLDLNQYSMAAAQPGLAVDVIERVRAERPCQREQERVANFLDEQTARIDALIAEKRTLASTLTALRAEAIDSAILGSDIASRGQMLKGLGELGVPSRVIICPFAAGHCSEPGT